MPHLTPEQMQRATAYLPVEQVLMVAAYLSPEMLQYQINHIDDNRAPEIITSAVIIGVLAIAAVVLRLYCRRTMKVAFSYDDYLIIMGLSQYAFEFLWSAAIVFIKLSILMFYRRLFPQHTTTARWRACHLTLFIASVILGIISIFGAAFQCTPVAYLWDKTIPGGHCVNFSAFARFTNVGNMLTDILILALPIPIVWSLQLDRSKKIGVCGLFLLGGFVCIASIVRFIFLEGIDDEMDPTWVNVNAGIWSAVEPSIGVVSACLPIMGPLLRTHVMSFSTSVFRSRKYSGEASSAPTGKSGSRDRRSFGRIGADSKGSHLKGSQDEEMGIPLKESTVQVREVGSSGT
ncbi:MAG: hypothetical protein L6R41_007439 [Letrouitia leprolyta]|nr:MAG: hypothetical protein L6R41_007439 [Letrouitia leprolyta]